MRERRLLECKYVLLSLVSLARWLPVGRGEERFLLSSDPLTPHCTRFSVIRRLTARLSCCSHNTRAWPRLSTGRSCPCGKVRPRGQQGSMGRRSERQAHH